MCGVILLRNKFGHVVGNRNGIARRTSYGCPDACCQSPAYSRYRSTLNGDVTNLAKCSSTDSRSIRTAYSIDRSALYDNVATGVTIACTYASAPTVGTCIERTGTLNGEGLAGCNGDAGTLTPETPNAIRTLEHDGGIAEAGDTCPVVF